MGWVMGLNLTCLFHCGVVAFQHTHYPQGGLLQQPTIGEESNLTNDVSCDTELSEPRVGLSSRTTATEDEE